MTNTEMYKNAGFISEDELVELVDTNDINGGIAVTPVTAITMLSVAISNMFTVTSACTTKC